MLSVPVISSLLRSEKAWVLLDQVSFSASSFITTVLLARVLSISQFGVYSSLVLYLYLLLSVSNALITAPFQVLLAGVSNQQVYISTLLVLQLMVTTFLLLFTVLIFCLDLPLLQPLWPQLPQILLLVTGFLFQDFFRRLFLATQKAKTAFWMDTISGILQLSWLLLAGYQQQLDTSKAIFIVGATYIPSIGFAFFNTGKLQTNAAALKLFTKQHWMAGKWLLLTSFLQWWGNNFLVAAAGLFLGINALAALRLCQTLFGVLNALLQVFENYGLPRASALYQLSKEQMVVYLRVLTKWSLLLLVPVTIATLLFAEEILLLCGGRAYIEYAYALQGMGVLYIIIFFGYPVRIAIRVLLLNSDFFIAYCISFSFSLLSATFFIRQWHLYGVIAALIINQLLMLFYWQFALSKKKIFLWKSFT
jgi:O-antigen/teichoic acid export membrane protein